MGYFCSPVFWQIRFLVESLTKKSQQACTNEINEIVALYGQDAELFCLSCLVKEIDLNIVGSSRNQRDQVPLDMQAKLSVLSERVENLWSTRQGDFAVFMRRILEGAAALSKEAADEAITTGESPAGPKEPLRSINVQQLELVCRKVLQLNSSQQLCVGIGLSTSANKRISDEGARFLVSTLFESMDISDRDADADIVAKVLWVLRSQHVFLADAELSNSCLLALQDRLPKTFAKLTVAPFTLADPLCVNCLEQPDEEESLSLANIVGCIGVDGLMEDLGPSCTASTETLKSVLEPICTDRDTKLGNEDLAAILGMMARTQSSFCSGARGASGEDNPIEQLQSSFALLSTSDKRRSTNPSNNVDQKGWDVGIVVHVAKELSGGGIDADKVIQLLGTCAENLTPETLDKTGFDLIVRAYKLMKGGKPLPGMALLDISKTPGSLWENRGAQMALLFHAATAPADAVTFAAKEHQREIVAAPQDVKSSPSGAWESVDFVATLDTFAGSGYYQFVKALFEIAVDHYPETLLLGLLQIKSPFDALREETYAVLLPKFLQSIHLKVPPLQAKLDTVKAMWKLNHFVLLRALVALYARDASFLPFVVEIVRQQPDGMAKFLDLPITTLVFDAICCASRSDPQEYDLDRWLLERAKLVISQGQNQARAFARNLLTFVQRKAVGPQGAGPGVGAPLSPREIEIIFSRLSILAAEPGLLTPDFISELAKTYEACGGRGSFLNNLPDGASSTGNGSMPGSSSGGAAAGAAEKHSNALLQALYSANKSPMETVEALVRMKQSSNPADQNVFNGLVHGVLDKYRVLESESDRNVQLTGIIVGTFIQRQLISSMALGIALRYVLEALRKPTNSPYFRFGILALDQIKGKLAEWPQTAAQVVRIPHMRERYPDLVRELESVLATPINQAAAAAAAAAARDAASNGGTSTPQPGTLAAMANASSVVQQVQAAIRSPVAPGPYPLRGSERTEERYAAFSSRLDELIGGACNIPENIPPPSADIEDRMTFIINNLAQRNLAEKVKEAKEVLESDFFPWVAFYLVAKRVSTQGNYHTLYMSFLDQIDEPGLMEQVRIRTLATVRRLLGSNEIVTSTNERSVLKNLGSWLGRLTLAKNKPLLHRELNLKGLLLDGYERGWLIAVVPFAAKILDGSKGSRVFTSHNPWVMGLLRTLAELYQLAELKLNLKFEIEVLCKNLLIDLKGISPSSILRFCRRPQLESNPDFNFKASDKPAAPPSPVLQQQQAQSQQQQQHMAMSQQQQQQSQTSSRQDDVKSSSIPEHTEIPNLAAYVHINPTLQLFIQQPNLRRVVPVAVDRAIREIIQPVVERSVTIACITTREMITKDFAMEPDEKRMRKAAHLMVSNLAGSLALVTCKEPLRASMSNHLRLLLASCDSQAAVDEVVQNCALENLELGCMLIEKAATEKAMRDIDEQIEHSLNLRRDSRERHNQPYFDRSVFQTGNRYPGALPDNLRPTANVQGLSPNQLLVYEAFQRAPRQPMVPPSRSAVGAAAGQMKPGVKPGMAPGKPSPVSSMGLVGTQALEKWRLCLIQVNRLLQDLLTASPAARSAGVNQLPNDHEILAYLREMRNIGQQIVPGQRDDAVRTFVQPVFKRLYEVGSGEKLVLEVHLAMLELLRDLSSDSASLRKSITEWVMYAPVEHKLNRQVTIGLIKTKLIILSEFDVYLAKLMEMGRQLSAVSFAMDIVRECILGRSVLITEMLMTLDTLQKISLTFKQPGQHQVQEIPGLDGLLENVRMLAAEHHQQQQQQQQSQQQQSQQQQSQQQQQQPQQQSQQNPSPLQQPQTAPAGQNFQPGLFLRSQDPPQLRQQVAHLLHRWIQLCATPDGAMHESVHRPYMAILQQQGALKGNENALRFFRITTELCVESSLTQNPSSQESSGGRTFPNKLSYVAIDAFCKLVVLLVKYADLRERTSLLSMVLDVIAGVLCREFLLRSQQNVEAFLDQRPYFRLFLNLQQDLIEAYEVEGLPEEHEVALLATFADVYLRVIPPSKLPGFSFAWLELISHRCFMPKLLRCRDARAWELLEGLLVDLFKCLQPYLREAQLTASVRVLYKGTLRVLLVLLHDFPEFLCSFHFSLCDVIPPTCIQLRNLVLSAFPRSMQLLDPFTPDLRVERLPEVQNAPTVLSKFKRALDEADLLSNLDEYLSSGQPGQFLVALKSKLVTQNATTNEAEYNVSLINALVLHVGVSAISQLENIRAQQTSEVQSLLNTLQQSSSMNSITLYTNLLNDLDEEGRYILVNAMANQLRFPNSHTHFFSSVLLYLFLEARQDLVREQITRVLLERLIVHRPHPWGLLITFIELIKNPRFRFWNYSFTRCAPEIHRLFESVARSCMSATSSQSSSSSSSSNAQDSSSVQT